MSTENHRFSVPWAKMSPRNLFRHTSSVSTTMTSEQRVRYERLQRRKSIAHSLAMLEQEEGKKKARRRKLDEKWEAEIGEAKRRMWKDDLHHAIAEYPQSRIQIRMEDMERWVRSRLGL